MMKIPLLLIALIAVLSQLPAEIHSIKLKWNPYFCQAACNQSFSPILQGIPEVASVEYDANFGEAKLIWKPKAPFNFQAIDYAVRGFGLNIDNYNITVSGTITHSLDQFYLTSTGDNTRFKLLGPLIYEKNRYTINTSEYTHPLTQEVKSQLLEAEKKHAEVAIYGWLFEPYRYVWKIVIYSLKVEDKSKKK